MNFNEFKWLNRKELCRTNRGDRSYKMHRVPRWNRNTFPKTTRNIEKLVKSVRCGIRQWSPFGLPVYRNPNKNKSSLSLGEKKKNEFVFSHETRLGVRPCDSVPACPLSGRRKTQVESVIEGTWGEERAGEHSAAPRTGFGEGTWPSGALEGRRGIPATSSRLQL